MAGYSVECGLKACIMAYVEATGAIFQDKTFAAKCWTHDVEVLLGLANLEPVLAADCAVNAALFANWATVKVWTETSRYTQATQTDARRMYDAIADNPDGVLQWIRMRW